MKNRFGGPFGLRAGVRLALLVIGLSIFITAKPSAAAPLHEPPASVGDSKFHLLDATISDVQNAIKTHQITCTQLVQLYLARIKAYNGVCVSQPNGRADNGASECGAGKRAYDVESEARESNRQRFRYASRAESD